MKTLQQKNKQIILTGINQIESPSFEVTRQIPSAIKSIFRVVAFSGLMAGLVQAAWIIPISATSSSETNAINAINGSGLSSESISGLHAAGSNNSWSMIQGNGIIISNEYITVDLGALHDLTHIHLWQFTRNTVGNDANRSLRNFDVLISADGVSFTEVISNATLTKAIDVSSPVGIPDGNEPVQSFALVQSGVRYVQIGVDTTYEGSSSDWQGGFGEVRFEGTLVPEPSTALLGGLGLLALLRRRR